MLIFNISICAIWPTPYSRKLNVLSVSLNKILPFLPNPDPKSSPNLKFKTNPNPKVYVWKGCGYPLICNTQKFVVGWSWYRVANPVLTSLMTVSRGWLGWDRSASMRHFCFCFVLFCLFVVVFWLFVFVLFCFLKEVVGFLAGLLFVCLFVVVVCL